MIRLPRLQLCNFSWCQAKLQSDLVCCQRVPSSDWSYDMIHHIPSWGRTTVGVHSQFENVWNLSCHLFEITLSTLGLCFRRQLQAIIFKGWLPPAYIAYLAVKSSIGVLWSFTTSIVFQEPIHKLALWRGLRETGNEHNQFHGSL